MPITKFEVAANDLIRAVSAITLQAKFHYIRVTAKWEPAGVKTLPVNGKMTLCEALDHAMKGTGYDFEVQTADRNVVIYYARTPPAKNSTPTPVRDPVTVTRLADTVLTLPTRLAEVSITGSYLHDTDNVVPPIIRISNSELSQAGFATVQDALYTLPLNSLAAPREDANGHGESEAEAGVNLRGLGSGTTLVLMNSQRLAASGLEGEFTDISKIPLSAVERVEVLTDGASAQYGSDAIAGVVNIIMRNDFEGAETQFRVGGAPGGRDEGFVSQLFGKRWETGNIMLAYEFTDATPLLPSARGYAADGDKRPYGGANHRSPFSNPGNIIDPATMYPLYGVPTGQDGLGLSGTSFSPGINLANPLSGVELFPARRLSSLYLSGSESLGDNIHFNADAYYSRRDTSQQIGPTVETLTVPRSNPYFADPPGSTASSVLVDYSFVRDFGIDTSHNTNVGSGATAGVTVGMAPDWTATICENYSRDVLASRAGGKLNATALNSALADSSPATAFNAFGDGSYTSPATLAAIRMSVLYGSVSDLLTTNIVIAGPLVRLAAGEVKVAIGGEHRREEFSRSIEESTGQGSFLGRYGRGIDAAFAELAIPLIANRSDRGHSAELEVALSGRYEGYSDFGQTVNPQARLRWVPLRSLKLRGSWTRAFRAPTLDDLHDTSRNSSYIGVIPDPKSPTGYSLVAATQGTNPALRPERATTWTAGIDWVPEYLDGLTTSLTYYGIDYRDQIETPAQGDPNGILLNESEWSGFITRNPTHDQVLAICNRADYVGPRLQCDESSPAVIIDGRFANLGVTRTQGLDVEIRQAIKGSLGQVVVGLRGTEVFRYDRAASNTAPAVSILNTFGNPIATRFRSTVEWSRNGPSAPGPGMRLTFNYTGGYRNPESALLPRIASWMTVDGEVGYHTAEGSGWLDNIEVSLTVVNAFNQSPPFVDWLYGYDYNNVQPLGRVTSVLVRKTW
jgi:iron complex outermembrane recepter protein